ncbi:S1 RNA-binding domain-containing protein [Puia sp. P3]|uniref:S1 RNA-binding domain-containing protein n=1 Tax=Puia sp. P3 TaxID=3423952 RepID=UPI003D678CB9
MEDLKQGMTVPGIVTNITAFGVFVDIGVKQDGLVHISQLSNTYVSDPNSVVKLQQKVMVTVLEVDGARKRISLSMKGNTPAKGQGGGGQRPGSQGGVQKGKPGGAPGKGSRPAETPDAFQCQADGAKEKV